MSLPLQNPVEPTRQPQRIPVPQLRGKHASGVFWYATGRSHRSIAVPPTDVDVEVVAGYGPPCC